MNIINTFNDKRFTLNGIQYFKNYISVVHGNKVEIFNCYERKDVLVELTQYNQFSINGIIYKSSALLQEALLPIIYSRANMGDGGSSSQNNIGKTINLGLYTGDSSIQAVVTKMNNITTVISATDTPVILSLYTLPTVLVPNETLPNNKKHLYLFKPGMGTYGMNGTKVTAAMISQFATLNLTSEDIQNNPKAIIHNLGTITSETFIQIANKSTWDFSDSGDIDENGHLKTYYFSYSKNDVLYFDQFKGTAGVYGSGKIPFTEKELTPITNSNVASNRTLEQILAEGGNKNISQFTNNGDGVSPFTTIAKLNGLTISVNQAAAEMYLKNSEGTILATVNLAFLNNEGTTFFYNETTKKLELKNDAGTVLSEVPVSAFVSNLIQTVDFNGANSSILEFKDATGNVVDSATFTINNIAGLQAALNTKANLNGGNTFNDSQSVNGNINIASGRNLTWGGTYESGNPTIAANGNGIGFYPSGEDTALYITHEKNIGINKVDPSYPLDVNGIGRFKRTGANGGGLATASIVATDAKTINDGISQTFQAHNSADSEVSYANISANIDSSTAGTHAGSLDFRIYNNGVSKLALKLSKEGNVGIGTSTPQAKLDIDGSIRVISTGGIEFGGSAGNGHPFIGGAKNDGLYFFTNTANNSTERLRLLPNGNVGIGLSNPTAKLEVNGTGKFSGEVTIPNGTAPESAINKSQLDLKANLNGGNIFSGYQSVNGNLGIIENNILTFNGNYGLQYSGTYSGLNLQKIGQKEGVMFFKDSGEVAVNTTSPEEGLKFQVEGYGAIGTKGKARIYLHTLSDTMAGIQSRDLSVAQNLQLSAKNILIDATENVGIGTVSPAEKLHVVGNIRADGKLTLIKDSYDTSPNQLEIKSASNTRKTLYIGLNSATGHGQIHAETNGLEYNPIEINPVGGNVLIGTAIDNNINKLQVNGTGRFTGEVTIAPATSKNNAVNLGQLGIQSGDAHEKGYLKSVTLIGNDSTNYQDNDLIGSKIKYIIFFRGNDNGNHIVTILNTSDYIFNSTTGTVSFLMGSLSYIVVNYVK